MHPARTLSDAKEWFQIEIESEQEIMILSDTALAGSLAAQTVLS